MISSLIGSDKSQRVVFFYINFYIVMLHDTFFNILKRIYFILLVLFIFAFVFNHIYLVSGRINLITV